MVRYGKLFESIFSMENLYAAYKDARKGKRKKKACFEFEKNLGVNLAELFKRIHNETYKPDSYFQFVVYEPKKRVIHAPSFRDTVIQHAIYRVVYDFFDKSFISTSYACRIGYGTHKASRYMQACLQYYNPNLYILKLDIRKFFYSIDRGILRSLICKKIKDRRLVAIMMMFAEMEGDFGIPIGNLLSQIYALIYLNPLDHFVKRVLKIKHYVRYVDDFILCGLTRDACVQIRRIISEFLLDTLHLVFSKSSIQKIKSGVNFVGYRTWQSKKFIRKHSLYKFSKAINTRNVQTIISIAGHAKHTNSLPYMMKRLRAQSPTTLDKLPHYYQKFAERSVWAGGTV